jgi:ornithine cyclodeaminase/alanine dehydrogenase-like protein (mu-crystallin family)
MRAIEKALRAHSEGRLVAPPRHRVDLGGGALVFTIGGENMQEKIAGFRVYDTFHVTRHDQPQMTIVYDLDSGDLKGLVVGRSLGGMRTGSIGGVAIKYLAREDARTLTLLGTGFQARFQLMAANAARNFERIVIYSRTPDTRKAFIAEMSELLGRDLEEAHDPEAAVRAADVLICATSQTKPIFDAGWLKRGAHVTTIGPQLKNKHEIPLELLDMSAALVTDSATQIDDNGASGFLHGAPHRERLIELGDVVTRKRIARASDDDITLFLSIGLAGTEVYVADEAIRVIEGS